MLIFFTMLFVLFCKSWNLGKPLAVVGQTASKGSTTPRSVPCLICGAASPALTAGRESGQYPERSEARSEACSAFLPLKLGHDYFHLLSLTPHKLKCAFFQKWNEKENFLHDSHFWVRVSYQPNFNTAKKLFMSIGWTYIVDFGKNLQKFTATLEFTT